MPKVLRMAALEVRDPMALDILVISGDPAFHFFAPRREVMYAPKCIEVPISFDLLHGHAWSSMGVTHPRSRAGGNMQEQLYPVASRELAQQRTQLAPEISTAFKAFGAAVFADGALPGKTKQLIAVAAAHVTQCPYCIRGHTEAALKAGATEQEIMEAIWVAVEMRAGAAYAHSILALETMSHS